MTSTSKRRRILWAALLPFVGSLAGAGCNEDKEAFEVVPLEGKIEAITSNGDGTGELTVSYYSDKHKQEVSGTGRVTKETEVLINGVVARLEDLREGEHVRGDVRIDKKGDSKTRTVLRIHVDRPKPVGGGTG